MASSPVGSVQGLVSNIQWKDLVDQMIQIDTQRELVPVQNKVTERTNAQSAWTNYQKVMGTLQSAAQKLASGSAFSSLTASITNSPTTGRTLLTATASSTATPGSYGVQVLGLAAAQQLSGNVVSDATAAASISGQIIVGGRAVTIAASDSINDIRDKINALNSGASATRVSASVLQSGASKWRLVLSSDVSGAAGIDIRDARALNTDPSVLTQLGFISGSSANVGADGITRSATFSSSSGKLSDLTTGVSSYPAGTINVNGRAVSIDTSADSLTDIAAKINAQSPNAASVETVTSGTTTTYRLNVSGSVTTTASAGSQPVLDFLGLTRGATGVVSQQMSTSNVLLDSGDVTATSATTLLGLKIAGQNGAQNGDTFTITGTKPDGTTRVSFTETVDGVKTVNDLLTDLSTAFSAPGRHVTAAIVGGKIRLTDDAGGDSGMSFSIAANNESGVADPLTGAGLSFGAVTTDVIGRQREVTAGADARIAVNGVTMTRSSNSISDAIAGVTLNLQQAEIGTTIPVTITRDTSSTVSALQAFATAYNNARQFVTTNTANGAALAYNATVRDSIGKVRTALLANVPGLATGNTFNHATLVGVTFDKAGVLQVDSAAVNAALASNPDAVRALFATNGLVTGADLSYVSSTSSTQSGAYDINITRAATTPSVASTAANFVYAAGASTDTMTIGDSSSGGSGSVTLVTGDTPATVASKLNTLFVAKGMRLSAASTGGTLSIAGLDYGSLPSFTVAYASTGGNDVAAMLGIGTTGITTTVQNGLDVAGSFVQGLSTYTATGAGQWLTGDANTAAAGLRIAYAGTANAASGHIDYTAGLGGLVAQYADAVSRSGDGLAASQNNLLQIQIDAMNKRADDIQSRIDNRRAALLKQFTAMESALAALQAQGSSLASSINSLQSSGK